MDFSRVLNELRQGMKATRRGWAAIPGRFVVLWPAARMLMLNADDAFQSWRPTSDDLLAEDWLVASPDGVIGWSDGTVA